ncbi:MAG: enoyl-CoA hydratase/isomerase family protein [candidate division Zixibacteria bacterium]|nr:enoyl-CoA hydratase/isomerase family protein [candidate division Zixibacteria bacterium]
MKFSKINLAIDNRVARITLNAPPNNIIDTQMMEEITSAIESVEKNNPEIFLLLFDGAGQKAFSSGVEIREHTPELVPKMLTSFHKIFRQLIESRFLTLSAVHGHCLGGGFELAVFCDFVIAEEGASFGLPEIKLACFPPVAVALLPELIGRKRSDRLILTGESIDASTAHEWGLVSFICENGKLAESQNSLLDTMRGLSVSTLQLTQKLRSEWKETFLSNLEQAEKIYLEELTKTADMNEGIDSFLKKRKPIWESK